MLKRLLGAQWLAIGIVGAVSFVLSIFVARQLGPEAFGVYAQAVSLGALLSILIDGGFGKLLMRETVRVSPSLETHGEFLHRYAYGHALSVMAVLAFLVVVNPLAPHWPTLLATVGAFGAVVLANFSMAILRGQGRLMRDALWQIGGRLLTAFFVIVALWFGAGSPWVILVAQCVGTFVFLIILMRRGWIAPKLRIPRAVYATALPLVWLELATVAYFRADMLLFETAGVPKADIGSYGVAFRLIEAFLLLASPVGLLLFRRFRLDSGVTTDAVLRQVMRFAAFAGAIGLLVFFAAQPLADMFFQTVFGKGFALSADCFRILSLMLVFALANGVLGQGVLALGSERFYAWTATVAAIVNILGNLVLMPEYGVWAAAWMTVITEAVLSVGLSGALFGAWKKCRYAK